MKKITLFAALMLMSLLGNAQVDLYNGLIAYYPFNGNANDESGNGNNATVNGATLAQDRFGNANSAYSFNGNTISANVLHKTENDFTISFWFNHNSSGSNNILSWRGKASPNDFDYLLFNYMSGGPSNIFRTELEKTINFIGTACDKGTIDFSQSQIGSHYLLVRNVDSIKLYLDNVLIGTDEVVFNGCTTLDSLKDITLGSVTFNGDIDDLMIYNRALSIAEIDSLFKLTASLAPVVTSTNNIQDRSFNIFPNPVSNIANIQFETNGTYQVEVIDITGRIIYSNQTNEQNLQINTSAWAAGIYAVTISNENGLLERKKIVKK